MSPFFLNVVFKIENEFAHFKTLSGWSWIYQSNHKVDYFFCFQASDESAFEKQNIAAFSSQKCGEGNLKNVSSHPAGREKCGH